MNLKEKKNNSKQDIRHLSRAHKPREAHHSVQDTGSLRVTKLQTMQQKKQLVCQEGSQSDYTIQATYYPAIKKAKKTLHNGGNRPNQTPYQKVGKHPKEFILNRFCIGHKKSDSWAFNVKKCLKTSMQ